MKLNTKLAICWNCMYNQVLYLVWRIAQRFVMNILALANRKWKWNITKDLLYLYVQSGFICSAKDCSKICHEYISSQSKGRQFSVGEQVINMMLKLYLEDNKTILTVLNKNWPCWNNFESDKTILTVLKQFWQC